MRVRVPADAKALHITQHHRVCLSPFLSFADSLLFVICHGEISMDHPLVHRLLDVKFETRRFLSLVTHGGQDFPEEEGRRFIADHFDISIQASLLYLVVVFGTKFFMRNRQPFSLFVPLNIWNFILAVFSILGMIKMSPEFWTTLKEKGFQNSYCFTYDFAKGENGYWVFYS
ncbi:hypothetical protein KIN20_004704 [Parelaphostrongylus tenuis]|uniref:Elongation of very long chain fatty acids protein n=1 Tax=Parelaphostrongylus tenuis TaxID=148309 RepID=A0AAD5MK71_PARTN|nr:hypothetical protein KIN20_004704 [Parelaphostrongylus tenuis]